MPVQKFARPISGMALGALVFALLFGVVQPTRAADTYAKAHAAHLSGSQEVPAVATEASGKLTTEVRHDGQALRYKLTLKHANDVTMAHLHCGAPGENGPVIADLYVPAQPTDHDDFEHTGVIMPEEIKPNLQGCSPGIQTMAHLLQAIREGKVYANVHSTDHPNGLIRGQLSYGGSQVMTPLSQSRMSHTSNPNTNTQGSYLLLSRYYLVPPQDLTIHGYRFWSSEDVRVTFRGQTMTVKADQTGHFMTQALNVPLSEANKELSIQATGLKSNITQTAVLRVGTYYPVVTPNTWLIHGGDEVTFRGRHFGPNEKVQLLRDGGSSLTTQTDAYGGLYQRIRVPQDSGLYTYIFKGQETGVMYEVQLYVQ